MARQIDTKTPDAEAGTPAPEIGEGLIKYDRYLMLRKSAETKANDVLKLLTASSKTGMAAVLRPNEFNLLDYIRMYSPALTKKEMAILALVREGKRNKGISVQLDISEETMKGHLNRIFKKLDVTNRRELLDTGEKITIISEQIMDRSELIKSISASLTSVELGVAALSINSDRQIGLTLGMPLPSVRSHMHNILMKTGCKSKTELVLWFPKHMAYREAIHKTQNRPTAPNSAETTKDSISQGPNYYKTE